MASRLGRTTTLPRLEPTRYEIARSKGGPKPGLTYLGAGAMYLGLSGFKAAPDGRVALRHEVGPLAMRLRLDYAASTVTDQWLKYDFTYVGGVLGAFYPLNVGSFLVEGGLEGGYGYATQRVKDFGQPSFASGMPYGGAALFATMPLGSFRLGLDVSGGVHYTKLNDAKKFLPGASAALLFLYGF